MNRRNVLQLAGLSALSMAAGAVALKDSDDWIVVCHKGTNSMARTYGEPEIIQAITDIVPGMQVREWCFEDTHSGELNKLLGIVAESRRTENSIEVRVRWVKPKPIGSFVTIHGTAVLDAKGRFEWLTVHHLDVTSAGSSFGLATAVA